MKSFTGLLRFGGGIPVAAVAFALVLGRKRERSEQTSPQDTNYTNINSEILNNLSEFSLDLLSYIHELGILNGLHGSNRINRCHFNTSRR